MAYKNKHQIVDGQIELYQRDESPTWYAAFRLPDTKTLRVSMKVKDRDQAEKRAKYKLFDLTQKLKRGLSLKAVPFSTVAKTFLNEFDSKVQQQKDRPINKQTHKQNRLRAFRTTIEKYFIPFFAETPISIISSREVERYKDWRKDYWINGPGALEENISYFRTAANGRKYKITRPKIESETREPNYGTLNKELCCLRAIFDSALKKHIISDHEIPIIKNERKPKDAIVRKPGITTEELNRLYKHLKSRANQYTNPKHKRHTLLLAYYIMFLSTCGIRPTEGKNLRYSDCKLIKKDGQSYLSIFVYGKGKSRTLIAHQLCVNMLAHLKGLHSNHSEIHGWKWSNDLPFFIDQYGKPVKSFHKSLNRAFSDADLLYDEHGTKRSMGCFRKYYITNAILHGTDYFQLAKNAGTSISVIEEYYASIDPTQTPDKLVI